jgi:hypothetical protein
MRIVDSSNLTLSLIQRNRYAPSRAASAYALRHAPASAAAAAARSQQVPAALPAQGNQSGDAISPALWPYRQPLAAPPADQPFTPHRLREPDRAPIVSKNRPPMADVTGRFIDVYA